MQDQGFWLSQPTGNGIAIAPTGATNFAIYDTIIENSSTGILVSSSGAANGVIKNVKMQFNLNYGFHAAGGGSINVTIEDSVAFSNSRGIQADTGPTQIRLNRINATLNSPDLENVGGGAVIVSYQTNIYDTIFGTITSASLH